MSGKITVGRKLDQATDSVKAHQGTFPWETQETTGLVPKVYDHVALGYDGLLRISTVVYRAGGASGAIVATLTIGYVGTSKRIASVARS